MRDRLIEILNQIYSTDFKGDYESGINDMTDRLLAEGVIVPPCKVGQTVYVIQFREIYECRVNEIFAFAKKI